MKEQEWIGKELEADSGPPNKRRSKKTQLKAQLAILRLMQEEEEEAKLSAAK